MPIYDYVCEACGRTIEVMHGVHAERPTNCEVCGGLLRKAMSAPAIVFKGSGWAKVDARAKSSPSKSSGGESDKGGSGSGDSNKEAGAGESGKSTSKSDTSTPAPAAGGAEKGASPASTSAAD